MPKSGALIAVSFVSGLLGGIAKALFLWACHNWGIFRLLKVNMTQSLTLPQLYPLMFIGGLWGLLYFLTIGPPRYRRQWVRKGLWVSLVPSLTALFYLYPSVYHQGLAALKLGIFAPGVIIVANLVWGLFTGFFHPFVLGTLMLRCLIILLLLTLAGPLQATELRGKVSWIYDGDTLQIEGLGKVRLLGIDTPEYQDSERDNFYLRTFHLDRDRLREVARQAKAFNIARAKGKNVRLETPQKDRDKHGRLLAYLYLPGGEQLNRLLLQRGLASVFRRYPFAQKKQFLADERQAQSEQLGLWAPAR